MTFYCSPLAPTHLLNKYTIIQSTREGGLWRDEGGGNDIVVVIVIYSVTHSFIPWIWCPLAKDQEKKHKATASGSPLSSNQFVLAPWFMNDQLTTCPPRQYIVLPRWWLPLWSPCGSFHPATIGFGTWRRKSCIASTWNVLHFHPVAYHHLGVALEYWKLIRCRFLIPYGTISSGRGFKASGGGRYPSMGILLRQDISFADAICFYAWRISYNRKREHGSRGSGGRRSRGLISGDSERSTNCKRCANITSLIMHTCCD